jgi:predicted anti-sigma-YlaC factor YlaD
MNILFRSRPREAGRAISFACTLLAFATALVLGACSPKTMAIDMIADALASGGGGYASDPDPDLIREALPFGLKTYEGLLESSPEHRGLLLATAKGFTAYAYMLKDEADRMDDPVLARTQRHRAKNLFLRGRDYALRGLEVSHPGFQATLRSAQDEALAGVTSQDTDFLYWAGAAWAGAVSSDKQDFMLVAELGRAGRLVERVVELDQAFDSGAAHQFLVTYEGGRPGGDRDVARGHYQKALELSGGGSAGLHLALAEAVAVSEQDLPAFRRLVDAAMAVDPDAFPDQRVANAISQRRARWLLTQVPDLFFDASDEGGAFSGGGT